MASDPVVEFIVRAKDETSAVMKGIETSFDSIKDSIDRLQQSSLDILKIGAALTAAFVFPVKEAAEFEKALSEVKSVTKANVAEMDMLREAAIQMGQSTIFSAAEAAKGLAILAQTGFTAQDSLTALPTILNLATAAQVTVAEATNIAVAALRGMGLSIYELETVTNTLAVAAGKTNATLKSLGEGLKTAGPAAHAAGQDVETVVAALGSLENAGIRGSSAGNNIKRMLISLTEPTAKATAELKLLGIQTTDGAGKMRNLGDIMADLGSAHLNMAQASKIFGLYAASAAVALAGESSNMNVLINSLHNGEGAAKKMAAVMADNVSGAYNKAKNAGEAFLVVVGDSAAGPIQIFLEKLQGIVNSVTDFAQKHNILTGAIMGTMGALGGIITIIGAVGFATTAAMSAWRGWTDFLIAADTAVTRFKGSYGATTAIFASAADQMSRNNVVMSELSNMTGKLTASEDALQAAMQEDKAVSTKLEALRIAQADSMNVVTAATNKYTSSVAKSALAEEQSLMASAAREERLATITAKKKLLEAQTELLITAELKEAEVIRIQTTATEAEFAAIDSGIMTKQAALDTEARMTAATKLATEAEVARAEALAIANEVYTLNQAIEQRLFETRSMAQKASLNARTSEEELLAARIGLTEGSAALIAIESELLIIETNKVASTLAVVRASETQLAQLESFSKAAAIKLELSSQMDVADTKSAAAIEKMSKSQYAMVEATDLRIAAEKAAVLQINASIAAEEQYSAIRKINDQLYLAHAEAITASSIATQAEIDAIAAENAALLVNNEDLVLNTRAELARAEATRTAALEAAADMRVTDLESAAIDRNTAAKELNDTATRAGVASSQLNRAATVAATEAQIAGSIAARLCAQGITLLTAAAEGLGTIFSVLGGWVTVAIVALMYFWDDIKGLAAWMSDVSWIKETIDYWAKVGEGFKSLAGVVPKVTTAMEKAKDSLLEMAKSTSEIINKIESAKEGTTEYANAVASATKSVKDMAEKNGDLKSAAGATLAVLTNQASTIQDVVKAMKEFNTEVDKHALIKVDEQSKVAQTALAMYQVKLMDANHAAIAMEGNVAAAIADGNVAQAQSLRERLVNLNADVAAQKKNVEDSTAIVQQGVNEKISIYEREGKLSKDISLASATAWLAETHSFTGEESKMFLQHYADLEVAQKIHTARTLKEQGETGNQKKQSALQDVNDTLAAQKESFTKLEGMLKSGTASTADLEKARAGAAEATKRWSEAQSNLSGTLEGVNKRQKDTIETTIGVDAAITKVTKGGIDTRVNEAKLASAKELIALNDSYEKKISAIMTENVKEAKVSAALGLQTQGIREKLFLDLAKLDEKDSAGRLVLTKAAALQEEQVVNAGELAKMKIKTDKSTQIGLLMATWQIDTYNMSVEGNAKVAVEEAQAGQKRLNQKQEHYHAEKALIQASVNEGAISQLQANAKITAIDIEMEGEKVALMNRTLASMKASHLEGADAYKTYATTVAVEATKLQVLIEKGVKETYAAKVAAITEEGNTQKARYEKDLVEASTYEASHLEMTKTAAAMRANAEIGIAESALNTSRAMYDTAKAMGPAYRDEQAKILKDLGALEVTYNAKILAGKKATVESMFEQDTNYREKRLLDQDITLKELEKQYVKGSTDYASYSHAKILNDLAHKEAAVKYAEEQVIKMAAEYTQDSVNYKKAVAAKVAAEVELAKKKAEIEAADSEASRKFIAGFYAQWDAGLNYGLQSLQKFGDAARNAFASWAGLPLKATDSLASMSKQVEDIDAKLRKSVGTLSMFMATTGNLNTATKLVAGSWDRAYSVIGAMSIKADLLTKDVTNQLIAVTKLGDALDDPANKSASFAASIERALKDATLLDKASLSKLRAGLESIKQAMLSFTDSVVAGVKTLQDEVDGLTLNTVELEMKRYQDQRLKYEADLKIAQAQGNAAALIELQKQLVLIEQLHQLKLKTAQDDLAAKTQVKSTGGTPTIGFSEGGKLPGGESSFDSVPVMARPGEWFIRNESVATWSDKFGSGFMEAINRPFSVSGQALMKALSSVGSKFSLGGAVGYKPTFSFSSGGSVPSSSSVQAPTQMIVFQSPNGREASGQFSSDAAKSMLDILKEAGLRTA